MLLKDVVMNIKDKKLFIVGTGEIANIAHEYFLYDSDYDVVGFAVNKEFINQDSFKGLPVVAIENILDIYRPDKYYAFVAFGNGMLNYQRTRMYKYLRSIGYKFASYISSRAFVWNNVKIGENCFILEDNTLQPFVEVGNNVVMWSGNHLGHSSVIKDNCFITSHVVISGLCEIGENTYMGVNSAVADRLVIAKDNYIAMGAMVNKSTAENSIYTGNPAQASKVSAKRFCKVKE